MKNVKLEKIYGNEETKRYLEKKIADGSLFHAVVISGKAGSGKKTLLKDILCALVCQDENAPCGVCPSCRKILSGDCVDILTIKPPEGRVYVSIESIRSIYDTIAYTPNDLPFKAYVIEDGSKTLPQTQNALLKLLEEPPNGVYFFILCEDEKKLLPTIRSRCEVFRLKEFSKEEIKYYLKERFQDGDFDTAAFLADGSIGAAVDILSEENSLLKIREIADNTVRILLDKASSEFDLIEYQYNNIKSYADYYTVCKYLISALRDILAYKGDDCVNLLYFTDKSVLDVYSNTYSSFTISAFCNVLLEAVCTEGTNTKLSLMITEFSAKLWKTKYNGEK